MGFVYRGFKNVMELLKRETNRRGESPGVIRVFFFLLRFAVLVKELVSKQVTNKKLT